MINIEDKSKCTGCTACANVCPKKCISMNEDTEGFVYPEVDFENCIDCKKCEKVCPGNNIIRPLNMINNAYVVRAKDDEYLMNGTSGGFVGPLIDYVLANHGICCVSSMDEDMVVRHVFVKSLDEWENKKKKVQGSKYVQSKIDGCFDTIKNSLCKGTPVLFIGTPCQVNGLRNYLGNIDISNLILVDIVCHGVPSHLLWDKYKEYQEKRYNSKIVNAQFRRKKYGYYGSTMSLEFANGKHYDGFLRTDLMLKAFYGNLGTRYSCFDCPAKGDRRSSDITIFDSWHAKQMANGAVDDNKGYTNVIIHSLSGETIWEKIRSYYTYYDVKADEAINYDGIMYGRSSKQADKRGEFYFLLSNNDLNAVMKRIMPVTLYDKLRIAIKKLVLRSKRIG